MRALAPHQGKSGFEAYGRISLTAQAERFGHRAEALGHWYDVCAVRPREPEPHRIAILSNDFVDRNCTEKALHDSERHAQSLVAELQHRVRNTLAVVRSIARRTAERSATTDEMISHFEGRLNAFSRVQSIVTRSPGAGVDLKGIVEDELLAVATREGRQLSIKGPEVFLKPRAAESVSLAVHELATNAVKYGALSAQNGRVRVAWERRNHARPEQLQLEWLESGLDREPRADREGFGHEMLLRTLPCDLAAETSIEFTQDGLRFTMILALGPEILAE